MNCILFNILEINNNVTYFILKQIIVQICTICASLKRAFVRFDIPLRFTLCFVIGARAYSRVSSMVYVLIYLAQYLLQTYVY